MRNIPRSSGFDLSLRQSARPIAVRCLATLAAAPVVVALLAATLALEANAAEPLQIIEARIEPIDRIGADVPLWFRVVNHSSEADALTRVRCPVANFSEKFTVDRGEGAPARRAIPAIPIAAASTTGLEPQGRHVMLLQTRQPLEEGSTVTCHLTFKQAGTVAAEFKVSRTP